MFIAFTTTWESFGSTPREIEVFIISIHLTPCMMNDTVIVCKLLTSLFLHFWSTSVIVSVQLVEPISEPSARAGNNMSGNTFRQLDNFM